MAVAKAFGPAEGLRIVDALVEEASLRDYHLLPTVRGDLLEKVGRPAEALAEFEASNKVIPNRFRTIAGAAAAARATGSVDAAKRYYRALTALAVAGDGARPEVSEAKTYLAQN